MSSEYPVLNTINSVVEREKKKKLLRVPIQNVPFVYILDHTDSKLHNLGKKRKHYSFDK